MITGHCRTNLDGYEREEWPREFVAVPREGERVRSKSGKELRVVQVTHHIASGAVLDGARRYDAPQIEVELHR